MATITVLQIDVLTEEAIELQLVKQNLMFTNHVTEGWELNLLLSHSWCNALGCVYPLQSFLTRVLEKMPFANLLCCVSPLEGERVLSKLTRLPLLKLEIF